MIEDQDTSVREEILCQRQFSHPVWPQKEVEDWRGDRNLEKIRARALPVSSAGRTLSREKPTRTGLTLGHRTFQSSDLGVKVTEGILGLYKIPGVVALGCAGLHVKGTSLRFVVVGSELPWAGEGSRASQGLSSKQSSVTELSPLTSISLEALGLGLQNGKDAGEK